MSYITPIIKWALPYLIKLAQKYLPELLNDAIQKIKEKKENKMAKIQLIAKDQTGAALAGVSLAYTVGSISPAPAVTAADGTISIEGFTSGDSYTFTPTLAGYTGSPVVVVANDAQTEVGNIIMTADTVVTVESTVKAAVTTAVTAEATAVSATILAKAILWADDKITALQAEENGSSKSTYVKNFRDPFEVVVLKTLVVAASTGDTSAIAKLIAKIK